MTEIFLTKMILNPLAREVRRDLGNPQELHKTISGGFPAIENAPGLKEHEKKKPRGEYNILHRLETDRNSDKPVLLVQSTAEPDWNNLPSGYVEEIFFKRVHDRYAKIKDGMNLRFRLQANPTKRIGKSYLHADESRRAEFTAKFRDEKKRRRIKMNKEEDQIKWLKIKGEAAGFELRDVKVEPCLHYEKVYGQQRDDAPPISNSVSAEVSKINFRKENGSPKITFGTVLFEGVLQVTDIEVFKKSLMTGIGTGKAYGFGLLSVALAEMS